jgi:MFS family permease
MARAPSWARAYLLAPSPDISARPADGSEEAVRDRNLHLTVVHGIFNAAAVNIVGPFMAIFAIRLGATQLHVALLTSAPAVASLLAMIPGARAIDRSRQKQALTARFVLISRFFYLALACVPFFPTRAAPTLFVMLLAIMNLPGAIANVAWQGFLARIVAPADRANAMAARNRLMSVTGTALALTVGLFLDRAVFPVGYQLAFVGAFLLSLLELAVFRRMQEPPERRKVSRVAGRHSIRSILRERRFVRYTLVSMLFYLAWQIPWPLYNWYQVQVLHANNVWVSVLNLLNTGGALFGYGFWRRFINRWGNLRSLVAATLPIFVTSIAYAFSNQLYTIAASNLLVGMIFSGVNILLVNTLLEMTPEEHKTSYIAYYNTAVTLSAIAAPLLGVGLLGVMSFKAAFLVTAGIRVAGSLCYYALYRAEKREERAKQ